MRTHRTDYGWHGVFRPEGPVTQILLPLLGRSFVQIFRLIDRHDYSLLSKIPWHDGSDQLFAARTLQIGLGSKVPRHAKLQMQKSYTQHGL